MGPAHSKFGYNEHPAATSRFLCIRNIASNVKNSDPTSRFLYIFSLVVSGTQCTHCNHVFYVEVKEYHHENNILTNATKLVLSTITLVDPKGFPPLSQISFIFMQFSGKNWPNIKFLCTPLELASPPPAPTGKSWIYHWRVPPPCLSMSQS